MFGVHCQCVSKFHYHTSLSQTNFLDQPSPFFGLNMSKTTTPNLHQHIMKQHVTFILRNPFLTRCFLSKKSPYHNPTHHNSTHSHHLRIDKNPPSFKAKVRPSKKPQFPTDGVRFDQRGNGWVFGGFIHVCFCKMCACDIYIYIRI